MKKNKLFAWFKSNSFKLMTSIRKRIFELVSTFFTLIGIIAAYHIYSISTSTKGIEINIGRVEYLQNYVHISKSSYQVDTITIIVIKIKNIGNQSITSSDFNTDITFNTDTLAISGLKVLNNHPENLHVEFIQTFINQIYLKSTLFNSDDEVEFQIEILGKIKRLYLDTRIVGLNKLILSQHDTLKNQIDFRLKDLESFKNFRIVKAKYGYPNRYYDVKQYAMHSIVNGKLTITASNKLCMDFDPFPNKIKTLFIVYNYCGISDSIYVSEEETVTIPKFKNIIYNKYSDLKYEE